MNNNNSVGGSLSHAKARKRALLSLGQSNQTCSSPCETGTVFPGLLGSALGRKPAETWNR